MFGVFFVHLLNFVHYKRCNPVNIYYEILSSNVSIIDIASFFHSILVTYTQFFKTLNKSMKINFKINVLSNSLSCCTDICHKIAKI